MNIYVNIINSIGVYVMLFDGNRHTSY